VSASIIFPKLMIKQINTRNMKITQPDELALHALLNLGQFKVMN